MANILSRPKKDPHVMREVKGLTESTIMIDEIAVFPDPVPVPTGEPEPEPEKKKRRGRPKKIKDDVV